MTEAVNIGSVTRPARVRIPVWLNFFFVEITDLTSLIVASEGGEQAAQEIKRKVTEVVEKLAGKNKGGNSFKKINSKVYLNKPNM